MRRLLPDPREDGVEAFISELQALVRDHRHDALLAIRDESVYAISAHRERLEPYVNIGLPEHEFVERAMDKLVFFSEAEAAGLEPPEFQVCEDLGQALDAARDFGFAVIAEGPRTVAEIADRSVRYPSILVANEAELEAVQRHTGTCIVQRWERGRLLQFGGFATDRALIGSLLTRSHRTWPPQAGNPTLLETVQIPPGLAEKIERLVRGIGWSGLFQLELIERPDGTLAPIDFNPRPYGSIGLARPAGVPLMTMWSQWLLSGEAPKPATAAVGIPYRWELGDGLHIGWLLRNRDYCGALRVAWPRRGTVHAHFDRRDPLPFLSPSGLLARSLWRYLSRARRYLRRRAVRS
jgi:predicted ATP-grasp superfamily ATP-dependent carboligase